MPPARCGFLLVLALTFSVSYAVGAAAAPVALGMHRSGTSDGGGTDPGDQDMGTRRRITDACSPPSPPSP